MRSLRHHLRYLALAGMALAAAAGCEHAEPCDPDQMLLAGLCHPRRAAPAEAGAPAMQPAGGDAGAGDAGAACGMDPFARYGEVCNDTGQCGCGTNWCAKQPGDSKGYCTRSGCKQEPSVCPAGWSCFDLAMLDPSLPSICVKPQR